jgi:hypothetical protein
MILFRPEVTPASTQGKLTPVRQAPGIEIHFLNIPDDQAPYGARGIGEIGITGAAAAIANAVYHATGNSGQSLLSLRNLNWKRISNPPSSSHFDWPTSRNNFNIGGERIVMPGCPKYRRASVSRRVGRHSGYRTTPPVFPPSTTAPAISSRSS